MTPSVEELKRYVSDRDGNMEPDDRDLSIAAVRSDSWVLATECYAALARQQRVIERYRKALQEVHLLCAAINRGRTHYEGCSADHPWCEVYGKVSQALAEDPTP